MPTDGGPALRELDCDYYERRRREFVARAGAATDPRVGDIHRAFAAAYQRRLDDYLATQSKGAFRL